MPLWIDDFPSVPPLKLKLTPQGQRITRLCTFLAVDDFVAVNALGFLKNPHLPTSGQLHGKAINPFGLSLP
jgi:hypothetical protein